MLARLRRSRLVLIALFGLSPGALGTALPVLHPCPVDAPWLAQHGVGSQPDSGHHHHGSSQAPSREHTCTCVGSCISSAIPGLASAAPAARVSETSFLPDWSDADASLVLQPLSSLLPPATAPPLV